MDRQRVNHDFGQESWLMGELSTKEGGRLSAQFAHQPEFLAEVVVDPLGGLSSAGGRRT